MAQDDLLVFLQERLRAFDENLDVTSGSPADAQVIQPILRRLGSDPFTMDVGLFIRDRLNQEFPDLASKEGDALVDLLIKPAMLLWDPFIREVFRIRNGLSFRDPATLTTDEADALGANLFAHRDTGDTASGIGRVYFAQPQGVSFTPANYFTSSQGLHFFPKGVQSIRLEEMVLNLEGSLYFFDVNVVAEAAGSEYNIPVNDLVSVANVTAAVRVTNKRRFRFGAPEEDAETFVGRAEQGLTERSLVTQRGIVAQVTGTFTDVTQLAEVGFNDPEMQRDVLKGGGLGEILAFGSSGQGAADGEQQNLTRRFHTTEVVDFTSLVGPVGVPLTNFVLTVHNLFGGVAPILRDLRVHAVVDAQTLDLEEQVLSYVSSGTNQTWSLRRRELTLSGIPGGILFPNGPNGTLSVPDDEVHIGGATDILVRGADLDSTSVLLASIADDSPILSGVTLNGVTIGPDVWAEILDFILSPGSGPGQIQYQTGDATFQIFTDAKNKGYSLEIQEAPLAGVYRVVDVQQTPGASPLLLTDPPLAVASSIAMSWRLLDEIDVNLAEPKETRITASDLTTVAGSTIVTTVGATDFQTLGVSVGDVLRILNGSDKGDFIVTQAPLPPFHIQLELDRPLTSSSTGLRYMIFLANAAGGVELPLVRVSSVDLLDTSGQPVGSKIPYALPVDIRSRGFANTGHGVRVDVTDARLGIVSQDLGSPAQANVSGLQVAVYVGGTVAFLLTFTGANPVSMASIISQINAASVAFGKGIIAFQLDASHFGVTSIGDQTELRPGAPSAMTALFGNEQVRKSSEIRSTGLGNWGNVVPAPTFGLDVVNVLDGTQVGFYGLPSSGLIVNPGSDSSLITAHQFAPELGRHVQFGSRSVGSARAFFLEPTSAEFGPDAFFSTTLDTGVKVRFLPDPGVSAQKIPARPSGPQPKTGQVTSSTVLTDAGQDFVLKAILPGDTLKVTFIPVTGSLVLPDPIPNLAGKTLLLSLAGGPDQTITFLNDSVSIPVTHVTRAGMVNQLNTAVGQTIAKLTGGNLLELEPTVLLVIRAVSTAGTTLLFSPFASDRNNRATNFGTYTVTGVTPTTLTASSVFASVGETRLQYQVFRPGLQRVSSTEMNLNQTSAGLFFMDVELLSEGTGDLWNIEANLQMFRTGGSFDGYFLTTDDPNLTFSSIEVPHIHISRTILEVGVADDPSNATQLSGQNLQVNYDRSTLVDSVNNFVTAETERVICESSLARHLIPHFVRFDLLYVGGSKEDVVTPDILALINGLAPDAFLEVAALEQIVMGRGASEITNPLELIAVVHNVDRSIMLDRSQDKINAGRLAAFIPDLLNIKRSIS
jgi:hypothetical protein